MRVVFESELRRGDETPRVRRTTCILDLNCVCTLACPDCLRGSRAGGEVDVRALVRRVQSAAEEDGIDEVRVAVHGGDPLLRLAAIAELGTSAATAAARRGVRFLGHVLAPGTLLTPDAARVLVRSGFGRLQVQLDGLEPQHDRLHPLRAGGGSFASILRALKFGRGDVRVVVRTRAPPGDPRVERLADRLDAEGLFAPPNPVTLLVAERASYAQQARQLLATFERLDAGGEPEARTG
jgi:sulfatase maturation enzyme AslB (radical SAM superfamily)